MKVSAESMDEPLVETELADSEPPRRRGPWKLILLVAVLTLVGVWLVPGDGPEETPTVAEKPTAGEPSLLAEGPAEAGVEAPVSEPSTEPAPVDDRPGARARALIAEMRAAGDIQPDQVFEAAQKAQQDGEMADAYLLYFFAAREGHSGAALTLGAQADPATRDPADSVFQDADLTQAHKWYQMAAQLGDTEAEKRLADLRSRVEQMAAGGDPQAQRISLLWQ
jgi:TPR repeat protein